MSQAGPRSERTEAGCASGATGGPRPARKPFVAAFAARAAAGGSVATAALAAPAARAALAAMAYALTSALAPLDALAAVADADVPAADVEALPAFLQDALARLRGSPPFVFFGAFVVATLLPFPIALFYLASGAVYGIASSLAWFTGALMVSNVLVHAGSRSILRPVFASLAARRGHRIPDFDSPLDEALFITLVRLTPGIPYFLQNVILAAARLDAVRFVVLSVTIQMMYATGFVVLGRSAFDGSLVWLLVAVAFLVAVTAATRLLAKRRAGSARTERHDDGDADATAPR